MRDLGRCPGFHSVVAQSLVPFSPFSVMLIPDLVQGCDVEEANFRHQGFVAARIEVVCTAA